MLTWNPTLTCLSPLHRRFRVVDRTTAGKAGTVPQQLRDQDLSGEAVHIARMVEDDDEEEEERRRKRSPIGGTGHTVRSLQERISHYCLHRWWMWHSVPLPDQETSRAAFWGSAFKTVEDPRGLLSLQSLWFENKLFIVFKAFIFLVPSTVV